MLTAGVDLAAESKGTALAVLEWRESLATVRDLQLGVDDARIVETAVRVDKLGIDCAFGWPDEFVGFLTAHANHETSPRVDGGMDWRRTLAYRETDREIRRRTGRWPLSVSTDRLGLTAMRCAGLLARIQEAGVEVDRSGASLVVEVYPGASLRMWGFTTTGYRANADSRAALLHAVRGSAPWLDVGGFGELMVASADAFDAVIAALAARNAALGAYDGPPAELIDRARREGWIALPTGRLDDLV
ncbi:MAG: DUF429 domain-containing protein [Mycetocola sp.]